MLTLFMLIFFAAPLLGPAIFSVLLPPFFILHSYPTLLFNLPLSFPGDLPSLEPTQVLEMVATNFNSFCCCYPNLIRKPIGLPYILYKNPCVHLKKLPSRSEESTGPLLAVDLSSVESPMG